MSKTKKAQVLHFDLYGKREDKYKFLNENSIESLEWSNLKVKEPQFFFVLKNDELLENYDKGFSIESLFIKNATGVKTERDDFAIKFNIEGINLIITDLILLSVDEIRSKYKLTKDGRDWQLACAKRDITNNKSLLSDKNH